MAGVELPPPAKALGISWKESARARLLAAILREKFEFEYGATPRLVYFANVPTEAFEAAGGV